jgi:hypothetical protein
MKFSVQKHSKLKFAAEEEDKKDGKQKFERKRLPRLF